MLALTNKTAGPRSGKDSEESRSGYIGQINTVEMRMHQVSKQMNEHVFLLIPEKTEVVVPTKQSSRSPSYAMQVVQIAMEVIQQHYDRIELKLLRADMEHRRQGCIWNVCYQPADD